jgi:hypothetical protein
MILAAKPKPFFTRQGRCRASHEWPTSSRHRLSLYTLSPLVEESLTLRTLTDTNTPN